MVEITKAILSVMDEVTNIEKGLTVGAGKGSYKAVSDSMVRSTIKESMIKHGLVIVPTDVVAKTETDRWEEKSDWGMKTKQSIFTQAQTKYKLIHKSGESIDLAGYGQGVDTQDKGAGKATTYALKNVLLDLFLVIKGEDVDTDSTHSNDIEVPPVREDAFVKAKRLITECKSIEECKELDKKIDNSKNLDSSQKIDLAFELQEKILTFDPTSE